MKRLVECPACRKTTFDPVNGLCEACGMRAAGPDVDLDTVLEGVHQNAIIALGKVLPGEFQQLAGLISPRAGHGIEDAIPFSDDTCRATHRYLLERGVLCARVDLFMDEHVSRNIILAHDQAGVDAGIEAARRAGAEVGANVQVIKDYN